MTFVAFRDNIKLLLIMLSTQLAIIQLSICTDANVTIRCYANETHVDGKCVECVECRSICQNHTFEITCKRKCQCQSILKNVCQNENGTFRCCMDYRKVDGECVECIGSWGIECRNVCPENTYGMGCRYNCRCKSGEICNRFNGCMKEEQRPQESCNTVWWMIALPTGSTFVTCVIWSVVLLICRRRKLWKKRLKKELRKRYELNFINPDLYDHLNFQHDKKSQSEIEGRPKKECSNIKNNDNYAAVDIEDIKSGHAIYSHRSKSCSDILNTEYSDYLDVF